MSIHRALSVLYLVLLCVSSLWAAEKTVQFPTVEQETRYHRLLVKLRCLKCANQSLADSEAGLAYDLRKKVYDQILLNKTEDEIIDYLVQRYGDYVLYMPRVNLSTIMLWATPIIVVIIALFLWSRSLRRHNTIRSELSAEDTEKLNALLNPIHKNVPITKNSRDH